MTKFRDAGRNLLKKKKKLCDLGNCNLIGRVFSTIFYLLPTHTHISNTIYWAQTRDSDSFFFPSYIVFCTFTKSQFMQFPSDTTGPYFPGTTCTIRYGPRVWSYPNILPANPILSGWLESEQHLPKKWVASIAPQINFHIYVFSFISYEIKFWTMSYHDEFFQQIKL